MITRGRRMVNLISKKDQKILEIFDRPAYESTQGVDLSKVDVQNLREKLLDSPPLKSLEVFDHSAYKSTQEQISGDSPSLKPVAVISPMKQSIQIKNASKVNLLTHLQSSDINTYINRNLNQANSEASNRYKLRENTRRILFDYTSDPNSSPDPFEDSGSAYSPTNSSSSNSSIAHENTNISRGVQSKPVNNIVTNDRFDKQNISPVLSDISIISGSSKDSTYNSDIEIKEQPPIVFVRSCPTKNNFATRRVRDKDHSCYFCQKILRNNLARHIEKSHNNEMEVAKILAMPKGSKKRREAFLNLTKYGDFYHNCDVLATKRGELILTRRPSLAEEQFTSNDDYGPCLECLGFYLKKHIWYHLKYKCIVKMEKNLKKIDEQFSSKGSIAESSALLNGILGSNLTPQFTANVVNNFKNDRISETIKRDNTILRFGAFLFEKYSSTQSELIRQSMRQLGRLNLELKAQGQIFEDFSEILVPEKFDALINATKALCKSQIDDPTKRPEFQIPSLALKIGYAIKKCIAIERGQCLRKGDLKKNKSLSSFLDLLNLEWSVRISSNALATLYTRKKTAADLLPITSDLVKLGKYVENEIKKMRENLTAQNFMKLQSLTLTRIILFNKRRSGETAKITLKQFASRPDQKNVGTEEIKHSLIPFELKLASCLTIIKVIGKRGRIVPILLTKEMKDSVELLISKRVEFGISCENPYIFAIPNSLFSHLRGHDCLKKWCMEANLESPELITSTQLRKYVATVCQVFNLTENECDWLARHLGHDIRVHRGFYRQQENAIELTKVSRLLLAVDQGEAHKFAGKKLNEINVEGEKRKKNEKAKGGKMLALQKNKGFKRPWSENEKEILLSKCKTFIKTNSLPGKQHCMELIERHSVFSGRKWSDLKFFIKNHLSKIKKMTST